MRDEDNKINHRTKTYDSDRKYYKKMPEKHWNICPLSIHLDRFLGFNSQDRLFTWKAALSNWGRFQQAYQKDGYDDGKGRLQSFQSSLSPSQRSSYVVLDDWWNSRYCSSIFITSFQNYLQKQQNVVNIDPELVKSDEATLSSKSLYHSFCSTLFLHEFQDSLRRLVPVAVVESNAISVE